MRDFYVGEVESQTLYKMSADQFENWLLRAREHLTKDEWRTEILPTDKEYLEETECHTAIDWEMHPDIIFDARGGFEEEDIVEGLAVLKDNRDHEKAQQEYLKHREENPSDEYEELDDYEKMIWNLNSSNRLLRRLHRLLPKLGRQLYAIVALSDGVTYRIALTGSAVVDAEAPSSEKNEKCIAFLEEFKKEDFALVQEVELCCAPVTLNVALPKEDSLEN